MLCHENYNFHFPNEKIEVTEAEVTSGIMKLLCEQQEFKPGSYFNTHYFICYMALSPNQPEQMASIVTSLMCHGK